MQDRETLIDNLILSYFSIAMKTETATTQTLYQLLSNRHHLKIIQDEISDNFGEDGTITGKTLIEKLEKKSLKK